jgi:DNA-binding transcriptional regulator YbjK
MKYCNPSVKILHPISFSVQRSYFTLSQIGLYANIEVLLADYRSKLEPRRELSLEEEELLMNLSAAYLKKQQEWKEEGVQTGIQQVAINLLSDGASLEFVAKATGLSTEVITQLREQNVGN